MDTKQGPFRVGEKVFVRTVTYHQVGRVKAVAAGFVELEDASWVAVSSRFGQTIKAGKIDELEHVGAAYVSLGAVVDVFPWTHDLPTASK